MPKTKQGWGHTSHYGDAAMARKCLGRIARSETTTNNEKRLAESICLDIDSLDQQLREPRNPE